MVKIKRLEQLGSTLYVFDFDDTLVVSPKFEDLAIEYLKEDLGIETMLKSSVGKIGVGLADLKWQDGRVYVLDPLNQLPEVGDWVRKGQRMYMLAPKSFYLSGLSLPKSLKPLSEFYSSVTNKCIVTAREESLRDKISQNMRDLGLEPPKFGLHMAPNGTRNAGHWKGEKIVEIISSGDFDSAIFYDDNSRYIKRAGAVIREELPNFNFRAIKVD